MKYLAFNKDAKHFEISTAELPIPAETDYLVKVKATCLNRVDILEKTGKYKAVQDNKILGVEFVGIPVDYNSLEPLNGSSTKLIGGIVRGGAYAEYALIKKTHAFVFDFPLASFEHEALAQSIKNIRPDNQSIDDLIAAAAIPEAYMTAYQLLQYYGNVEEGSFVYIPAAAGGIGSAAIQLAKHLMKAKVIASASSDEKINFCKKLGADVVLNYKDLSDENFVSTVMEVTGGKGVNCILDCIGPSKASMHGKIIAEDGHWVLYGFLGGAKGPCDNLMSDILYKRVSLIGSLLRNRSDEYKAKLVSDLTRDVMPLFRNDAIRPVVGASFDLDLNETSDAQVMDMAHSLMEQNKSIGRIIVSFK